MEIERDNGDGTVTFHLHGFKPVVCRLLRTESEEEFTVSSYEPLLSGDERQIRDSELVRKLLKTLEAEGKGKSGE